MIKANELREKQEAMRVLKRKQYTENDLKHALYEIEKLLIAFVKSDPESRDAYLMYSWLEKTAKADTNDKRHELCKALGEYGYQCELLDGLSAMVIKWSAQA